MEYLSEHFSFEEMIRSDTAIRLGLKNIPGEFHKSNLQKLCLNVLEPIRKLVGRPIRINSGYRSEQVNARIGGAKNSQHTMGDAADIEVSLLETGGLARLIEQSTINFDQLILECYKPGYRNSGWVHVSSLGGMENINRKEVLTFDGSTYLKGLHI